MDKQEITWNEKTYTIFREVVESLPQFHRNIAEQLVKERAQELAGQRNSSSVEDKDLIVAFFNEVPPAFKDMMKRLFAHHNIDYAQYIDVQKST